MYKIRNCNNEALKKIYKQHYTCDRALDKCEFIIFSDCLQIQTQIW